MSCFLIGVFFSPPHVNTGFSCSVGSLLNKLWESVHQAVANVWLFFCFIVFLLFFYPIPNVSKVHQNVGLNMLFSEARANLWIINGATLSWMRHHDLKTRTIWVLEPGLHACVWLLIATITGKTSQLSNEMWDGLGPCGDLV